MAALEIERKFLVMKPDTMTLVRQHNANVLYIEQTYLKASVGERRVRRVTTAIVGEDDYISHFYYTEKRPADSTGLIREENETTISYKTFGELIREADPEYKTINKTRYEFKIGTQKYELDIYDFEKKYAILEVELESENTEFEWPVGIVQVKEVTSDKNFKNKSIARTLKLPVED